MERLSSLAATLPSGLSDLRLTTLYGALVIPLIILVSIPIYYFTERPFMNGPGSRFIERILRGCLAWFKIKLAGWSGPSGAETDLHTQAVSHEPS
jgi:peptidoglycan/LPS O-acetylase OafA/YrhL